MKTLNLVKSMSDGEIEALVNTVDMMQHLISQCGSEEAYYVHVYVSQKLWEMEKSGLRESGKTLLTQTAH